MRAIVGVAISLALVMPALAAVTVVDGDTIKLDGTTYRLWGIDAPELPQVCVDGFPAGIAAFNVLSNLVKGKTVGCELRASDGYSRIALCRADGLDMGAMMVRSGWAWAFVRYTTEYLPQEVQARAALAGVHGHNCEAPWKWRARDRR